MSFCTDPDLDPDLKRVCDRIRKYACISVCHVAVPLAIRCHPIALIKITKACILITDDIDTIVFLNT